MFKKGFRSIYQHCGEQHFKRYLNEFAFRYNNRIKLGVDDDMRDLIALRGVESKRLTYGRINTA